MANRRATQQTNGADVSSSTRSRRLESFDNAAPGIDQTRNRVERDRAQVCLQTLELPRSHPRRPLPLPRKQIKRRHSASRCARCASVVNANGADNVRQSNSANRKSIFRARQLSEVAYVSVSSLSDESPTSASSGSSGGVSVSATRLMK
jgi:hypothetical protein